LTSWQERQFNILEEYCKIFFDALDKYCIKLGTMWKSTTHWVMKENYDFFFVSITIIYTQFELIIEKRTPLIEHCYAIKIFSLIKLTNKNNEEAYTLRNIYFINQLAQLLYFLFRTETLIFVSLFFYQSLLGHDETIM
jgi:hypothetical protein